MVTHDRTLNEAVPGVRGNDSGDTDGDPVTAILVDDVTNGTLTFNADGSFAYTPNAGYVGSDNFTYKLNDGLADSNTATVTVNVTNAEPTATDASTSLIHSTPTLTRTWTTPVVYSDPDGDVLTVS